MSFFFPILIISLVIVFGIVLFAFFPVRISWFYCVAKRPPKPPPMPRYGYPDLSIRNFRHSDEESYDDKEL